MQHKFPANLHWPIVDTVMWRSLGQGGTVATQMEHREAMPSDDELHRRCTESSTPFPAIPNHDDIVGRGDEGSSSILVDTFNDIIRN